MKVRRGKKERMKRARRKRTSQRRNFKSKPQHEPKHGLRN